MKILLAEPDDGCTRSCRVHCPQGRTWRNRPLYVQIVRDLITHYRLYGREPGGPVKGLTNQSAEWNKLTHWGLIESCHQKRPDGGGTAGWYKITAKGENFIFGGVEIPKYVELAVPGSEFVRLHGDLVSITDVDSEFDFTKLERGYED